MHDEFKKYKIKRKFKPAHHASQLAGVVGGEDIEPEEILMDSKRLKESPDGEREKLEKPIKEKILKIFLISIISILGLLLIKGFELQIIKGDYWRGLADENRIRSYPIGPLRGIIYDRNKTPLAINIPKLDLLVIPADLVKEKEFNQIIERLAQILMPGEDPPAIASREALRAGIETKIKENIGLSYPIIIEEDIPTEKALLLESQFSDIPTIRIRKNSRREYENGPVFSHVLGYLGKVTKEEISEKKYFLDDYIGRAGIENIYEDILKGVYGEELIEIDSLGRIQKVLAKKEPIAGQDLVLSIDAELQEKIYNVIKVKLNTLYTARAAAVAINPQNGKILALLSFPSFDNNEFVKGLSPELFDRIIQNKNEPLFNRAISANYPPGSTIKPLIALAALQEGVITPNKQINCPGYINLFDKYNPNIFWTFNDWKAHGTVEIIKAIAESCDVYFYTLGGGYGEIEGLGIERIEKYVKLFGWGNLLGIDLPNEKPGFIPNSSWKEETKNEEWYIGDTYNVSIGQGDILASPLQVAIATAVIANGGKLFQPQLLDDKEPKIINQDFIKKEFLEIVKKGMRESAVSGSSRLLADLPIKAAGKTGTAQVSKTKAPHSWFTVFAPYENPEIVLTILVENGGEGSAVAVPIAKEILAWYFNR
ncbi:MAG: penicillin-binding protein 2 [Patescibacteria group bacterium]